MQIVIEKFILKEIKEKNETTNFIKTSEIPDRFKNCKITEWTITFGKKGTYYSVSKWFDPNETEDPE